MSPGSAVRLPPPDLAHDVTALYRLGTHARIDGPPEQGHLGRVWPLRTSTGRYAVKVPSTPPDPNAVAEDAAYQDAARAAGVNLPAVVRTPDGGVLARIGEGTVVRVYEWAEILGPDRSLDPAEVGRTVAAIHTVDHPHDGQVNPWHTQPVGAPRWRELAERALAAGAPFAQELNRLVPELTALEALLEPPGGTQRCHCDLWADNVRGSPTGELVVLDWENSGAADPAGELPMVMFDFGLGEPARMRELYAAYVVAGGPARVAGPADCSMLVATLGHIVEAGVTGWLGATTAEERDSAAAWVAEGVGDPLTRRVVDTIVAAATSVTAER